MSRYAYIFVIALLFVYFSSLDARAGKERPIEPVPLVEGALGQKDRVSDHILGRWKEKNSDMYHALRLTHGNNPTILAGRAKLEAVREQLPQARSGFLPSLTASGNAIHTDTSTEGTSFVSSDGVNFSQQVQLDAEQPLFRGGRTYADIKTANAVMTALIIYMHIKIIRNNKNTIMQLKKI